MGINSLRGGGYCYYAAAHYDFCACPHQPPLQSGQLEGSGALDPSVGQTDRWSKQ